MMCIRYCIEAVDRTLRVIMKSPNVPLGGKCVLFSRDLRQILSVVPRGSRSTIFFMSFKSSPLYQSMKCLKLTQSMRVRKIQNKVDPDKSVLEHPDFLMKLGEGKLKKTRNSLINLSTSVDI